MNEPSEQRKERLQSIPSVEEILQSEPFGDLNESYPRPAVVAAVREALEGLRKTILTGDEDTLSGLPKDKTAWIVRLRSETGRILQPSLRTVLNATGVIIHTNLGRSVLAPEAIEAVRSTASDYSNLEFDLEAGKRGSRYSHVEGLLCRLTGAEAAMVVNNNAGAVLITLNALAKGREVLLSRGELVEIGGSFRMPDVMDQSGAVMVEVGTTNKTHLKDFESAVNDETGMILKVHTSNYRILGFTEEVPLKDLVELGRKHDIPVVNDLGSGCLVDFSEWGLEAEPTVQDALATGVDLVTFSGDKLMGGPQAGLILGKKTYVDRIRKNPLNRALRIDKFTLAALEATLRLYWDMDSVSSRVPTLSMIKTDRGELKHRAERLARRIRRQGIPDIEVRIKEDSSQVGGGSLPLLMLPTWVVGLRVKDIPASRLERALRAGDPPVIARILKDEVVLDVRTVPDRRIPMLADAMLRAVRLSGG